MSDQKRVQADQAVRPLFFGIDVGGTGIKIGLTDDRGATIDFKSIETLEPRGPADAMRRVGEACQELLLRNGLAQA